MSEYTDEEPLPEDVAKFIADLRRAAEMLERLARENEYGIRHNEKLEQRIDELEAANMSVAVCSKHIEDITQGNCVICECERLDAALTKIENYCSAWEHLHCERLGKMARKARAGVS